MFSNSEIITHSFHHLRQTGFELGLCELLAAFEAMEGGWGDSKEKLALTLKLLWCKSQKDIHQFDKIWEKTATTWTEPEPRHDEKPDFLEKFRQFFRPNPSPITSVLTKNEKSMTESVKIAQARSQITPLPVSLSSLPSKTKLSTLENHWPISPSKMVYTWRYLRRPLPGHKKVIDVERTIIDTAYQGFYLSPSYRRERHNYAHLILLIDQDGSMMPFHPFTRDIVKTAQKSTVQIETFYFHNQPTDYLYQDAHLLEPIEIQKVFQNFSQNTAILIISDAGAARGYRQRERINETMQVILQLQNHTQQIAWLNPMPEERWVKTSANIIAHLVPMFEINQTGFSRAINLLQGL